MIPRRKLITGLLSLVAAPAIVPYSSLMLVKTSHWEGWEEVGFLIFHYDGTKWVTDKPFRRVGNRMYQQLPLNGA